MVCAGPPRVGGARAAFCAAFCCAVSSCDHTDTISAQGHTSLLAHREVCTSAGSVLAAGAFKPSRAASADSIQHSPAQQLPIANAQQPS